MHSTRPACCVRVSLPVTVSLFSDRKSSEKQAPACIRSAFKSLLLFFIKVPDYSLNPSACIW